MVGVVCGLASEAAVIRRAWASVSGTAAMTVLVSGADPRRAETAARHLCESGAEALLSLGLCGGLAPGLLPGDTVLATAVVDDSTGARHAAEFWRSPDAPAAARRSRRHEGAVLGVDRAITSVAGKAAAFARTGALAVDMESHAVARVAARAEVPMMAVRAVVDDAGTALPAIVDDIVTAPSGRPRLKRLIGRLARHPGQWPAFVALARSSACAHRSLEAEVVLLAQGLQAR